MKLREKSYVEIQRREGSTWDVDGYHQFDAAWFEAIDCERFAWMPEFAVAALAYEVDDDGNRVVATQGELVALMVDLDEWKRLGELGLSGPDLAAQLLVLAATWQPTGMNCAGCPVRFYDDNCGRWFAPSPVFTPPSKCLSGKTVDACATAGKPVSGWSQWDVLVLLSRFEASNIEGQWTVFERKKVEQV